MKDTPNIRRISYTLLDYSRTRYPRLSIQGASIGDHDFGIGTEFKVYNPKKGYVVAVFGSVPTSLKLPPEPLRSKRIGTSLCGTPLFELQGKWFLNCGIYIHDFVEVISPVKNVITVSKFNQAEAFMRERSLLSGVVLSEWLRFLLEMDRYAVRK